MDSLPDAVRDDLESYPNVIGTCLGPKRVDDRSTDEQAVIVLVSRKLPEAQLAADERIPETVTIDGEAVPTDVQEVGEPGTQAAVRPVPAAAPDRKGRFRPAPAGVSCGHPESTAGTLGSPPLRTADGETVVLTNAHVAAPLGVVSPDDPLYQPGPADGGEESDTLGRLHDWSEIARAEPNRTDSALVRVDAADLREDVLGVGPLVGFTDVAQDATYTKSGRTTGVTTSDLRGRDARIQVRGYYDDPTIFEGVDVFGPMSAGGDSGSLIGIDRRDGFHATDLLFAGSDRTTLGIPLDAVQTEHGELDVIATTADRTPFRERVGRRLRREYGERVGTVEEDPVAFRVETWPVPIAVATAATGEEAIRMLGEVVAAAGPDEHPVVCYPAGDRTEKLDRAAARTTATLVGIEV